MASLKQDVDRTIRVLLVDDQEIVAKSIEQMLSDQPDIELHYCQNPRDAIALANKVDPTVILQDLIMPEVDGLTMVRFFRSNEATKEVPMIVLSSREEAEVKSEAFGLGANDYMVKLPDKLEVLARIRYHSKAYQNLLDRNAAFDLLKSELEKADRYVQSLLPDRLSGDPITTDWYFQSSLDLGGDSFGYYSLDDEHFVVYLVDVCGHGVGAALLSVSIMNTLRNQGLSGVDFKSPQSVLEGLNESFKMEDNNQMFFTIWYGVYHLPSKKLRYASGGHPNAVCASKDGKIQTFGTGGLVIGAMPDVPFKEVEATLQSGDRLYVFSDGVYELKDPKTGREMVYEDLQFEIQAVQSSSDNRLLRILNFCKAYNGTDTFEDDYSIIELEFA